MLLAVEVLWLNGLAVPVALAPRARPAEGRA